MFPDIVLITFSFSLVAIEIKLLHGDISVSRHRANSFFMLAPIGSKSYMKNKVFRDLAITIFSLDDIEIKGLYED